MKVSRYALFAFSSALIAGLALNPVLAQSTAPATQAAGQATQAAKDASSDAMKSNDSMKSDSSAPASASSTGGHKMHKKSGKHHPATKPAAASTAAGA